MQTFIANGQKGRMQKTMNESGIKIVLDNGAFVPERAHEADAGYDLKTPFDTVIRPGGSAIIDTGVHIAIPMGYFGKIESKSGLNVNHGIVSCGGVIDSGYTGSIRVKLYNFGRLPYTFRTGEKIAQLIIQPCILPELIITDKLLKTERGNNGFGSSGK